MLTDRFDQALGFAAELHREQRRKGTAIPYMSHLLGVTANVLDYGGSEDQAIAALLHDAVEDQQHKFGGARALKQHIEERFGAEVRRIVEGCTDAEVEPKPPWHARKQAYIAHLAEMDAAVALVSCCDKLHNARSILADLRIIGGAIYDRFTGGRDGTLWYYRSLADAFAKKGIAPAAELARVVADLEVLTAELEVRAASRQDAVP
jgi:(p)ppGpp synthase/HD superfamily hydrolase